MSKKILFIVIFLIFTLFSYPYFKTHLFSFHFVDEDENIIAGYYMGKGEKFYQDIFSHKQPLPAVLSMTLQKIHQPTSLKQLISNHRQIIYYYSFFWSILLIVAFGFPALVFVIFFELVKHFQLGDLFLAESLVVFPLVFSLAGLLKLISSANKLMNIIFAFSLAFILFLQFTLIPYVIFILAFLLILKKIDRKFCLLLASCFLLLFLICLSFVDYREYLKNTYVAITLIYFNSSVSEGPLKTLYYSFFRPLSAVIEIKKSEFGFFLGISSIIYILSFLHLFLTQQKLRKILLISFTLLGLTGLRIVPPGNAIYNGFHSLPWLGLFLYLAAFQSISIIKDAIRKRKSPSRLFPILAVYFTLLFLLVNSAKFMLKDYYQVSNQENNWFINYSRLYDYGQIIKIMSGPGDKLMVLPVEQLIYWQSGLPHASRFLYIYVLDIPQYKKEFLAYWDKYPPEFFYDEGNFAPLDKKLTNYLRLKKEGNNTPLLLRKDKIKSLTEWQANELKRLKISID